MAEFTAVKENFLICKEPIASAFIGGKNVVAIYLGKNRLWSSEEVLSDETEQLFVTEDGALNIFIDK